MSFLLSVQIAPYLVIQMNSLTSSLRHKWINSHISDLTLWCGIFVYRLEKPNVDIKIALFFEFILFLASMTG